MLSRSLPRRKAVLSSPPPERGRSDGEAIRVGVASHFDRTQFKTSRARRLRREGTDVETKLWLRLRNNQLGHSFRRQHPAGPYVLDFYAARLGLVIELDGGQHNERAQQVRDKHRDAWLKSRSLTVLRFWNSDVTENLTGVLERIKFVADELAARPTPTRRWRADLPLSGGGDKEGV